MFRFTLLFLIINNLNINLLDFLILKLNLFFRDISMKPNEKHEDDLSEDKTLGILKNVQSRPITYTTVKFILKLILDL